MAICQNRTCRDHKYIVPLLPFLRHVMNDQKPRDIGALLLEIGALLMGSGANTNRVRLTIGRIAGSYGFKVDFLITHRAIMLTLNDKKHHFFSEIKQTYALVPNFKMVSGISRLSWHIVDEKPPLETVWEEIERLKALSPYPRIVVLSVVALACSSFCRLAGGNPAEMLMVFAASFCGLFVKQELSKKKVNPYFAIFLASFITAMLCGGIGLWYPHKHDNMTFVTSILYLIPGIPLINSMSDFIDGNSLNGMMRAINGLLISFAIASGLLIAILIFNVV